ncbi:Fc.00g087240.m01.CDS01 [Cosmosporella sp. VM-42]
MDGRIASAAPLSGLWGSNPRRQRRLSIGSSFHESISTSFTLHPAPVNGIMVRIKERYLLVNIVYPPDPSRATKSGLPDLVAHHQPTVEKLTPQALLKGIKAEVASLYGDYGSGALGGNIAGMKCHSASSLS